MYDKVKYIYNLIPPNSLKFLKHIPDNVLFGKAYREAKNNISFNKALHQINLYNLLSYNKKHTQYGKENIKGTFYEDEIFDILYELPLVSSNDVSENIGYFKSNEFNSRNSYETTTGGTGRRPTRIILSNKSYGIEWAHMHHIWLVANYERSRHLKLTLRGISLSDNKLFQFNPVYNEIVVNSFGLNKSNFKNLINSLKKYNIVYIHGYPSLVSEFKNYLVYHNLKFKVRAIFLGSEGASKELKNDFHLFFGAKIISWYGQSEKVILAVDEEAQNRFKLYSSYGFGYITNKNSEGFGEIVGCSYVNRALPLINYKTGDYGIISSDNEHLYLEKIKGRWGKDFIYVSPEKKIPTSSINIHGKVQKHILFYQLIQSEFGVIHIKVLPVYNSDLSKEIIIKELQKELHLKLSEFEVTYEVVPDESYISRSKRGKMIFLIQNLNKNN